MQLSKVIKHLQAQLEHQEAVGTSLEGQLATALAELERLQAFEANQQEIIEQACSISIFCMRHAAPCCMWHEPFLDYRCGATCILCRCWVYQ